MIFGGVPFYWDMFHKGRSVAQSVDELLFSENGALCDEYTFLFRSLFNDSAIYSSVVSALSKKAKGLTRKEIQAEVKISDGGRLTEVLNNLANCDFIRQYAAFGKSERNVLYQLTDLLSLFHLRYLRTNRHRGSNYWMQQTGTPEHNAWCGYAFEQVCLHHIPQIKQALGISGVVSDVSSWTDPSTAEHAGGQIGLVISRRDKVINLCEMKFSSAPYEITESYRQRLIDRRELFRTVTKTRSALHVTMVTSYGIKHNANSDVVASEATLDDLFRQ